MMQLKIGGAYALTEKVARNTEGKKRITYISNNDTVEVQIEEDTTRGDDQWYQI